MTNSLRHDQINGGGPLRAAPRYGPHLRSIRPGRHTKLPGRHTVLHAIGLAALCSLPMGACSAPASQPASPAQVCHRLGTDDTLRPVPASVVPEVNALFHTRLPPQVAMKTTVFRCDGGQALVCTAGANLPCGKANTSRHNAGARRWCRANPDARSIPAYAVGHDTVFAWRCRGSEPEIQRQVYTVDYRGFIPAFWRRLPERPGD